MKGKFFLDMLKKEKLLLFFLVLLYLLVQVYFTFSFYDPARFRAFYGPDYGKMTSEESTIFSALGLSGVTKQAYLLPFVVFIILLVLFLFLFSYLSSSLELNNVFLLKIKGDEKVLKRQLLFQGIINFFSFVLAIFLYALVLSLIDHFVSFQIPLFVFDIRTIYFDVVYYFLSLLLFSRINQKMTSNKKMLSFLREEY